MLWQSQNFCLINFSWYYIFKAYPQKSFFFQFGVVIRVLFVVNVVISFPELINSSFETK